MADPRPLLERLLNSPGLATVVPRLAPEVMHRVIERFGLEDCAELVALVTPAQLAQILDLDIWRAARPGIDETFDADRFGLWLEVLMQAGAAVAAEKLSGLDLDLVVGGFARHARVFDLLAVSSFTTLDGEQAPARAPHGEATCEIGGYVIEARRTAAWDAIVDLLAFLAADHPDYFGRLMRGCVRLSNGPREADGFHHLLDDREQEAFDLGSARDARREQQGYVAPPQARAFLQTARAIPFDSDAPPHDPLTRAYFRDIEWAAPAETEPPLETVTMAPVVDILRDAGVVTAAPRGLLDGAVGDRSRLALIEAHVDAHEQSAAELAYLANTIAAGCSLQGRAFSRQEAFDAAVATCNLGLENWPPRWRDRDLVSAFQVGWTILHRDVCLYAAAHLIDVLAALRSRDRDIQMRLLALERALTRHLRDRTPWHARPLFDVIVMLDAPAWAGLLGLIDECPVVHGAVRPSARSRRTIEAADFAFIAENREIESVRQFMASLPSALRE